MQTSDQHGGRARKGDPGTMYLRLPVAGGKIYMNPRQSPAGWKSMGQHAMPATRMRHTACAALAAALRSIYTTLGVASRRRTARRCLCLLTSARAGCVDTSMLMRGLTDAIEGGRTGASLCYRPARGAPAAALLLLLVMLRLAVRWLTLLELSASAC